QHKGVRTEDSCRKFLDEVAQRLAILCDFHCGIPAIDDVFYAIDNTSWDHRPKKCRTLQAIHLPDYFPEQEWVVLKELQRDVSSRVHQSALPTTSKGRPSIAFFFTSPL
ncbi:TPA: hypothetical protein N0F65_006482, partial [Lagenidium giganteum]